MTLSDDGMKDSQYTHLVNLIHLHRTWVDAFLPKEDATLMARSGTELVHVRRKVMTLVAVRPRSVYPKGHVWNIPEDRLDRAVRSLKRDSRFAGRWKREELTCADAGAIVRHATNGLLDIDLDEYD